MPAAVFRGAAPVPVVSCWFLVTCNQNALISVMCQLKIADLFKKSDALHCNKLNAPFFCGWNWQGARVAEHENQTVAGRLTAVVEESGQSRAAFARLVRIGDTTLKSYMSGATEPGVSELIQICEIGGVRLEWLVYGREPRRSDAVAEAPTTYGDPNDWVHRRTVEAVVVALQEELQAQLITPPPAKQADLVVAACLIFRRPDAIDREVIRRLIMVAK